VFAVVVKVLILKRVVRMTEREIITLQRDCMAFMVPSGARIILHEGTEVTITQSLGNSYTVSVYGNLARIDANEADALGKEPVDFFADMDPGADLDEQVVHVMRHVFDPEIPVNIVDLGLVYGVDVKALDSGEQSVTINLTLTAPGCGMGPVIADDVKRLVSSLEPVKHVEVEFVFDPPWERSMMSEAAQLQLGVL
jgi:probable FeS assembly SUF system protein SufT